jgi:polar amino acid transport system permease protein
MTVPQPGPIDEGPPHSRAPATTFRDRARDFPYWLAVIFALLAWMVYSIATNKTYNEAYHFIIPGLRTTIEATVFSFLIALGIGLLAGLGRIAHNPVLRNIALTYIEFIRGVPILVLIATVSFVIVPSLSNSFGFDNSSVTFFWRACIALSVIYGAYLAEVFRAGIESVPIGQTEAGRSLGMSHGQTMRLIVLPQAVRNMTPAIGNDLIAMLKDSSLLSFLAVNELTQNGRLYAASTFNFRASYFILTMLYLSLTLVLSLLLRWYRSRLGLDHD